MRSARYNFRLERVRALREDLEDLAGEAFAVSQGRRRELEAHLQSAATGVDSAREVCREAHTGTCPAEMAAAHAYLLRVEGTRRDRVEDLRLQETEVERRRVELTQAARDRQVLEQLKDRGRARHRKQAEQREGTLLDEIAINRHRRAREAA